MAVTLYPLWWALRLPGGWTRVAAINAL